MIRNIIASLITVLLFAGCTNLNQEQEHLLEKARYIKTFPVKRSNLISMLEISGISSEHIGGGVRGGRMSFLETWRHPSGLTITAYDSEYVGHLAITRESIDAILNNPNRNTTNFVGPLGVPQKRQTFEGFVITNGEVQVYSSKETEGEQAAPRNR